MGHKHIDELQAETVDEHLRLILEDNSVINDKFVEVTVQDLPEWYDDELFKRGQKYVTSHGWSMAVNSVCGLLTILSVPEILKVLTYTQKTNSVCAAFNRYIQTWLHVYALYHSDSMDSNSKWYKSLNVIRWRHWIAHHHCIKNGMQGIRSKDMALTQFGFFGYALIHHDKLGLSNRPEERESLNHLWRVIAHVLGIPERLNICRKTADETEKLCLKLCDEVFAKNMTKYDKEFLEASQTMLDAFWYSALYVSSDVVFSFTYSLVGLNYREPLSLYCRLEAMINQSLLSTCHLPIIGNVVKMILTYYSEFLTWMMENYPLHAILKFGKENVRIVPYPKISMTSS